MQKLNHLTPNNKLISYDKLYKLVSHQINYLQSEIEKVDDDLLHYLLHDDEELQRVPHYKTALEQWEWLLEVLEEQHESLTF